MIKDNCFGKVTIKTDNCCWSEMLLKHDEGDLMFENVSLCKALHINVLLTKVGCVWARHNVCPQIHLQNSKTSHCEMFVL